MSDGIREWALTVCSASVFFAAVSILIPDEKYEKIINMSLTALMLLIVVSPLHGIDISNIEIDVPKQEIENSHCMEELINSQAAERISNAAERVLKQKLDEQGILTTEISVFMDISENGCISIGHVTVELDQRGVADPSAVKLMLEEWTGTKNIEVIGGSNG